MSCFIMCVGITKPPYGVSGLPQTCFSFGNNIVVTCRFANICKHIVFVILFENTKWTWKTIPYRKMVDFVLSSHIDPISDQNDVQYLFRFVNLLYVLGIYGTVSTITMQMGNVQ